MGRWGWVISWFEGAVFGILVFDWERFSRLVG